MAPTGQQLGHCGGLQGAAGVKGPGGREQQQGQGGEDRPICERLTVGERGGGTSSSDAQADCRGGGRCVALCCAARTHAALVAVAAAVARPGTLWTLPASMRADPLAFGLRPRGRPPDVLVLLLERGCCSPRTHDAHVPAASSLSHLPNSPAGRRPHTLLLQVQKAYEGVALPTLAEVSAAGPARPCCMDRRASALSEARPWGRLPLPLPSPAARTRTHRPPHAAAAQPRSAHFTFAPAGRPPAHPPSHLCPSWPHARLPTLPYPAGCHRQVYNLSYDRAEAEAQSGRANGGDGGEEGPSAEFSRWGCGG